MTQAFHGGRLSQAATEFALPQEAFLDFSSNLNVFAPRVASALWQQWLSEIASYPQADAKSLRGQLAEIYQLDLDLVLPTSGAIEALYLAARLFSNRKVVILEPAFSDYARAFEAAGCQPHRLVIQPENWQTSLNDLAGKLECFDVVVLGNPNNPTGSFHPRQDLENLLTRSWERPKSWLVDEAFIEFVANHQAETLLPILAQHPSLLVVRSLTKSWCIPGLRLGFIATSNRCWMDQLIKMQAPWSINAVAQAWAKTYLTHPQFESLISSLCALGGVRARFVAELNQIPGLRVHPAAANFLLLELTDPSLDASKLYQSLGKQGLLVRVCDSFHEMPRGKYIRIAVKSATDNARLTLALSEICRPSLQKAP